MIDPRDGQTQRENNVEVEEDHIDVKLNTSPVAYSDSLDSKQIEILAQKGLRRDIC